jgi:hypothetical protein
MGASGSELAGSPLMVRRSFSRDRDFLSFPFSRGQSSQRVIPAWKRTSIDRGLQCCCSAESKRKSDGLSTEIGKFHARRFLYLECYSNREHR